MEWYASVSCTHMVELTRCGTHPIKQQQGQPLIVKVVAFELDRAVLYLVTDIPFSVLMKTVAIN